MKPTDKDAIIACCRQHQVVDQWFIEPAQVVTADWIRFKCQFGCDSYGASLCCPPHTPSAAATRRILDEYQVALLLSFAGEEAATTALVALERDLFLLNYYKVISFAVGRCTRCDACSLNRCSHPTQARPSMQACGIDVFGTLRSTGIAIDVVADKETPVRRYALLLIE